MHVKVCTVGSTRAMETEVLISFENSYVKLKARHGWIMMGYDEYMLKPTSIKSIM